VCACVCGAEKTDELDGCSDLYQAISELPQPNRDTLAYIILHLHRLFSVWFLLGENAWFVVQQNRIETLHHNGNLSE